MMKKSLFALWPLRVGERSHPLRSRRKLRRQGQGEEEVPSSDCNKDWLLPSFHFATAKNGLKRLAGRGERGRDMVIGKSKRPRKEEGKGDKGKEMEERRKKNSPPPPGKWKEMQL